MPQSYDFIFISARDFCQKLLKKFGTHILLGKNLRHLRYLRDNEQVTLIHIKLGMTCKVRTGKQNIPFLFLVIDNCSHFSSDELIKPRQRYKKIFNISFVLNKKVLILFNTMDKMNKISTFVPHLSVIQHLSRTSRETKIAYMPR